MKSRTINRKKIILCCLLVAFGLTLDNLKSQTEFDLIDELILDQLENYVRLNKVNTVRITSRIDQEELIVEERVYGDHLNLEYVLIKKEAIIGDTVNPDSLKSILKKTFQYDLNENLIVYKDTFINFATMVYQYTSKEINYDQNQRTSTVNKTFFSSWNTENTMSQFLPQCSVYEIQHVYKNGRIVTDNIVDYDCGFRAQARGQQINGDFRMLNGKFRKKYDYEDALLVKETLYQDEKGRKKDYTIQRKYNEGGQLKLISYNDSILKSIEYENDKIIRVTKYDKDGKENRIIKVYYDGDTIDYIKEGDRLINFQYEHFDE